MVPSPPHVVMGLSWDLFSSLLVSSTLTPSTLNIFSSLTTFLSCLTQHSSHTTLILGNVFTILWLFASFFLKKSLKHIRKSYVFFFVSVNIVINLFVVVINLFVSILWFFFLKLILWLIIKSVITLKLLMLCPKN